MRPCLLLLLVLTALGCGGAVPTPRNSVTVWEEGTLGYEVLTVPPRELPVKRTDRSHP